MSPVLITIEQSKLQKIRSQNRDSSKDHSASVQVPEGVKLSSQNDFAMSEALVRAGLLLCWDLQVGIGKYSFLTQLSKSFEKLFLFLGLMVWSGPS